MEKHNRAWVLTRCDHPPRQRAAYATIDYQNARNRGHDE